MTQQGKSWEEIQQSLGQPISRQSFNRWVALYEETKCVIKNPDLYEQVGWSRTLSMDDSNFLIQLLKDKPGLFLEEIRERLYDHTGTLLSMEAVHDNLVNHLAITLKKADTINSHKCLVKKFAYVEQMRLLPAEFLVFTGLRINSCALYLSPCIDLFFLFFSHIEQMKVHSAIAISSAHFHIRLVELQLFK